MKQINKEDFILKKKKREENKRKKIKESDEKGNWGEKESTNRE